MCCLHCLIVPFCIAAVRFPHDAFARWDAGSRHMEQENPAMEPADLVSFMCCHRGPALAF